MRIYLAARYQRRAEMQAHGTDLVALGHEITSEWIWTDKQSLNDHTHSNTATPEVLREVAGLAWQDIQQITSTDIFMAFTEQPGMKENTGGRHVEFGAALALRSTGGRPKRLFVIGPRENVFYMADYIETFSTWHDVLLEVGAAPMVARR